MTWSGFPATDPATAEIPSLFGRNGTSRAEGVFRRTKVDTTVKRASHARPDMLQIRRITAFRELERSRLDGRSRGIEGAASDRSDGGSVKAVYAWHVTVM